MISLSFLLRRCAFHPDPGTKNKYGPSDFLRCHRASAGNAMPFFRAGTAAESGGVLSDEDRMSAHGSLFPVVPGSSGRQTFDDEFFRLFSNRPAPFLRQIGQFPFSELEAGTKRGGFQTALKLLPALLISILVIHLGLRSPLKSSGKRKKHSRKSGIRKRGKKDSPSHTLSLSFTLSLFHSYILTFTRKWRRERTTAISTCTRRCDAQCWYADLSAFPLTGIQIHVNLHLPAVRTRNQDGKRSLFPFPEDLFSPAAEEAEGRSLRKKGKTRKR